MSSKTLNLPTPVSAGSRDQASAPRLILAEGILLILGILAGAYIHYHTGDAVSLILQIGVLALFLRAKNNYPWIFILLFTTFSPGGLFSGQAKPLILITSSAFGIVSFKMLFALTAWLKVFRYRNIPILYQRNWIIVVSYILLLVLVFGARMVSIIRAMIFFSWLLVIPRLLNNDEEIDRLFYLIFLANIFVFLANIYKVTTAHQILSLFTPIYSLRHELDPESLIRTAEAIQFAHLSVIGGLYYLSRDRSRIRPALAYSGLVLGLLNIISSATRGWILSTLFLIIAYSFFMLPRLFRNIVIVIPVVAITVAMVWQVPVIRNQIIKAYERTLYFENILNPDLNEETTDIGRIQRGARVMDKFRESPWVGFGFSEEARQFSDGHAGTQTTLMNFGVFGFLLLLNLWLGYVFKLLTQDNLLNPRHSDFKLNVLMAFAFISVMIIHSTSGAFLHPTIGNDATFWYGIIFALGNYLYYKKMNRIQVADA
jgi:hypothetical protein